MEEKGIIRTEYGIDFTNEAILKTLKATVAVGLTDAEFLLFAEHCKGTKLNPFKKEVWAIKGKGYTNNRGEYVEGKLQIMTGINGFYAIANGNPNFAGIETGLIDSEGNYKTAAYPKSDFIGAWAKVHRKGWIVPIEAVAMLSEYDKSLDQKYSQNGIWRNMKRVMISKCAESVALRKAFPQELNGLYTEEEMPPSFGKDAVAPVQPSRPGLKDWDKAAKPGENTIETVAVNVMGDDAPPPMKKWISYDLNKIAADKLDAARALLEKSGAVTEDDLLMYFESPVEIKKLERARVGDI